MSNDTSNSAASGAGPVALGVKEPDELHRQKSWALKSWSSRAAGDETRPARLFGGLDCDAIKCCGSWDGYTWRTFFLRIVLIASLIVAAVLCALISYSQLHSMELSLGENTFESIAELALKGVKANLIRRLQGGAVQAQMMSMAFPDTDEWPFVTLDGYSEITRKLGKMSASTDHALIPFVKPEQAEEFEDWARGMYKEQGYPETAGQSEFGYGIWKIDPESPYSDARSHDISGNTAWGSPHKILTPILHIGFKTGGWELINGHANPLFGSAGDSLIGCAQARKFAEEERNATIDMLEEETLAPTPPTAEAILAGKLDLPPCSYLTDMFPMYDYRTAKKAAIIYVPIFPRNDPNTLVAMTATTVFWEDTLLHLVPSYFKGLIAVLSTDTQTFTFEVTSGKPVLLGEEDLHDEKYSKYARSLDLGHDFETDAANSASYTLTFYPSDAMFEEFQTSSPLAVSLGFLGAIALCTALFLLYDLLMRYEVKRRNLILQVKRRFVRFVSHEIRTPLNTVCMGLELLDAELQDCLARKTEKKLDAFPCYPKDVFQRPQPAGENDTGLEHEPTGVEFCTQITKDIIENTNCAVNILNDLLNYDKIESGTLKLEIGTVPITSLVQKTAHQFNVQAANKHVKLLLSTEYPPNDMGKVTPDIEEGKTRKPFFVVGDDLRLGQCIRNLISNALKFTPPNGTIQMAASHDPFGLPNAKPVAEDGSSEPHTIASGNQRCGSIVITVKDSGVGLTKEQLNQLFTEGVQFDANKLQAGGGSGLGLAITKGIIEQHGGSIKADSEGPGFGTLFTIELPVYYLVDAPSTYAGSVGSSIEPADSIAPGPSQREKTVEPTSRRILVVEDVHSSAKMLVRLLERSGHSCSTASNGKIAVAAVEEDMAKLHSDVNHVPFDTILMDFEMPIMNGPDATEKIRANGYKGIIFGVTGNLLEEDVDHFKSRGATGVLGKPISMGALNSCWAKHCCKATEVQKDPPSTSQQPQTGSVSNGGIPCAA